jgi:hypothetical protein
LTKCVRGCANDIICLGESKTDDTDEILLPGYIFKMKNRKTFEYKKEDE